MALQATLAQLIDLLQAKPDRISNPDRLAQGLTTDSRSIQPGQVFLALRGEKFDGHAFVAQAIAQGAMAAIVDTQFDLPVDGELPLIQVANTLTAYQAIGHWWRQQFAIPVIAITGSVGKTTTKELIAAVLSQYGPVLKTEANNNNEIGVPKTLLELTPDHAFAVIEMGMRGRGEIAELSQIAAPDIGVITNVGTAHIGRLGSREAIAQAKCELLAAMPQTATAILNAENPLLLETAKGVWSGATLTYGLTKGDLQGQVVGGNTLQLSGLEGPAFPLPLPGDHNALNYLAALGVVRTLGLDASRLLSGVTVDLPGGRAQSIALGDDIVLLDETYNAGLESMLAALRLLAQTPGQRRIAVLGTMKELGDFSAEIHAQVGAEARALGLDGLLILADRAEATAMGQGFLPSQAEVFESHAAVVARLQEMAQPGDRILLKASRAVGLDQVVTQLRALLA
jgi:UDP-N-acetylmuramoyl-tripeptide--D-alanyl-D-alanine ligase